MLAVKPLLGRRQGNKIACCVRKGARGRRCRQNYANQW